MFIDTAVNRIIGLLNKSSNQAKESFLVVGSDTGVGKTIFSGLLVNYLRNKGLRLKLSKPFCSGGTHDIDFLMAANGETVPEKINYWYGNDPVSPAAWELATGNQIDFDNIILKLMEEFKSCDSDMLLVEGVGGFLAPITREYTVASLGQKLDSKLIIVAQNRVGVINHVLLTVEAAISRALSVVGVVLMGQEMPDASAADNAKLIRMHMPKNPCFKGVFEFPCLGKGADNPDLIQINIKKTKKILEDIYNKVINSSFVDHTNN